VAAKLRILMKPSPTPPMGQYYIEHTRTGSAATPFSSLAASSKSMLAVAALAPPFIDLHSSTLASANMISRAPASCTDSEATVPNSTYARLEEFNEKNGVSWEMSTFAELEALNRRTGMGFDSKSWQPDTSRVLGPKKEKGEGTEIEVWQEL
jgi:hypothetical protein